jgi:hypothetical protein
VNAFGLGLPQLIVLFLAVLMIYAYYARRSD